MFGAAGACWWQTATCGSCLITPLPALPSPPAPRSARPLSFSRSEAARLWTQFDSPSATPLQGRPPRTTATSRRRSDIVSLARYALSRPRSSQVPLPAYSRSPVALVTLRPRQQQPWPSNSPKRARDPWPACRRRPSKARTARPLRLIRSMRPFSPPSEACCSPSSVLSPKAARPLRSRPLFCERSPSADDGARSHARQVQRSEAKAGTRPRKTTTRRCSSKPNLNPPLRPSFAPARSAPLERREPRPRTPFSAMAPHQPAPSSVLALPVHTPGLTRLTFSPDGQSVRASLSSLPHQGEPSALTS